MSSVATAYRVPRYKDLIKHVARLAYLNKDHLLFYRGQGVQYRNRAGGVSFYPSIYRGDQLDRSTVESRFRLLELASRRLRELFLKGKLDGHQEVSRKRLVQWSVLQHYQVCSTPLIDCTHSVRVACSFAQASATSRKAYVSVFGLPYVTNRISSNSEHDIVVVRLLSICPPAALRPYFQQGYLATTADVTSEYEDKNELDFNRRLIAQFEIPNERSFWGKGASRVSDEELFPAEDSIGDLCASIDVGIAGSAAPETLGTFLMVWTALEQTLVFWAQLHEERVLTFGQALRALRRRHEIHDARFRELEELRDLRNRAVHGGGIEDDSVLRDATARVERIRQELRVASR